MNDDRMFERLDRLEIETPSWGYGNSGTRFHVYPWPGAARTVEERIADAALVHRLTGCCPRVARGRAITSATTNGTIVRADFMLLPLRHGFSTSTIRCCRT